MTLNRRHEMGSGGYCICPKCSTRTKHWRGIPCQDKRCTNCGAKLIREASYHHQLIERKRAAKQQRTTT